MSEDSRQPSAELSERSDCDEQPFPSGLPDLPESEEYWEVRGICGRRRDARTGKIQYLVQWAGCPDEECTWEDEENCTDCCDMIGSFLENQRQIEKVDSIDKLATLLPAATERLKSKGVRFSTSKSADHSHHQVFLDNIGKERLEVLHDPKADGNCFFHCIIHVLKQFGANHHSYSHKSLRQKVVRRLEEELSLYKAFIEDEDPREYCQRMSRLGHWVDHVTIQITSNVIRRRIIIITSTAENWKIEISPNSPDSPVHRRQIYLGHLNNEHYITLQPIPE